MLSSITCNKPKKLCRHICKTKKSKVLKYRLANGPSKVLGLTKF